MPPRPFQTDAPISRRAALAGAGCLLAIGPATANAQSGLSPTPPQATGPFYPPEFTLAHDADLTRVEGFEQSARGQIIHVAGRLLTPDGKPMAGARVEIWQANSFGRYHHPRDNSDRRLDPGFQGFGHAMTGDRGHYHFKSVVPGAYGSGFGRRTPHIHFRILSQAHSPLTTQMYFAGNPLNRSDGLFNAIRDPAERRRLLVELKKPADGDQSELVGNFDIIIN